ncbi:1,2-phenylacetyl-CoA epoxidase subunit PaaD [Kocuria sp.]|uniref:1,2-phenylacetyl-CoA epoxidase subunit PaaD n=1 Tax=Kocuria sp. TaxID=1871328 RepID=UPI0026E0AFED|nr:1,2-phenylacetyl-CoA epoxidase subunit PaaD [Kocuria sp.]MDO5618223.1 1,2-phenylacetyl-CoA epoxidase subunit PaaD [Kocuria sp.]
MPAQPQMPRMDFEQDPHARPRPTGADVPQRLDDLRPTDAASARVWDVAATVNDPEIPVLSVADLGILRAARAEGERGAVVVITPTYSGCPAMETITADLKAALDDDGFTPVQVQTVLEPAWTTDWMTRDGKQKLQAYGIAPPTGRAATGPVALTLGVKCPRCDSLSTREMTRFGSTSCKALWVCNNCLEPFDHFKVH